MRWKPIGGMGRQKSGEKIDSGEKIVIGERKTENCEKVETDTKPQKSTNATLIFISNINKFDMSTQCL